MSIEIKSPAQIEKMRTAGRLAAETLVMVSKLIAPGITGNDIDNFVKEYTKKQGGICAPFGYPGKDVSTPFPKHVCISPNNVVCHGIPNNKLLDNSIFNVDITTIYDEAHGDTSATFFLGKMSETDMRLMKVTKECLDLGIQQVKHHVRLGDIGEAIQNHAENNGFSVVKSYAGHGIGIGINGFHMLPSIPHFGKRGFGLRLPAGFTHTIEPMLNVGSEGCFIDRKDGWTVYTEDCRNSAQWEHTILVTLDGYEILTKREELLKNSIEITNYISTK